MLRSTKTRILDLEDRNKLPEPTRSAALEDIGNEEEATQTSTEGVPGAKQISSWTTR